MTITYKGGALIVPREIKNRKIVHYEQWGMNTQRVEKTKMIMTPGEIAAKDCVIFEDPRGYKREVMGSNIKGDEECRKNGIGWYDPEELAPHHPSWYR